MPDNNEEEYQKQNTLDELPSYIVAANNHQIANNDNSLLDFSKAAAGGAAGALMGAELGSVVPGLGNIVGGAIGAITGAVTGYTDGKFTAAAAMVGTSSLINTGASLLNLLPGVDVQQTKVQDWMEAYDSNLPQYYADNKDAIDITGDIATSIIPGTMGLKVYNRAAAALDTAVLGGRLGTNLSGATGLLGGTQAKLIAQATQAAKETQGVYSYVNKTFVAATLAGAGEQAIQGAVFSAAAAAAMYKSPILEDADFGDVASNVLHAAMFQGILGGVLGTVVSKFAIGKVLTERQKDLVDLTHINEVKSNDSWVQVAGYLHSADTIKAQSPEVMQALKDKYGNVPGALKDNNLAAIAEKIRSKFGAMSTDSVINNMFSDSALQDMTLKGMAPVILGLKGILRVGDEEHAAIKGLAAVRSKINKGTPVAGLSADEQAVLNDTQVSYYRIRAANGVAAGDVAATNAPATLGIIDKLGKGEEVKITNSSISVGNRKWDQTVYKDGFSSLHTTADENEARRLFLHNKPAPANDATIKEYDLPLLAKAVKAGEETSGYKILHTDGSVSTGLDKKALFELYQQKVAEVTRYHQGSAINGTSKVDELTAKLKEKAGIEGTSLNTVPRKVRKAARSMSDNELARLTNTTLGRLKGGSEGVNTVDPFSDFFAAESSAKAYVDSLAKNKGLALSAKPTADAIMFQPSVVKLVHDAAVVKELDQFIMDGMVYLKQKELLWKQDANAVLLGVVPDTIHVQLPEAGDDLIRAAQGQGVGMKITGFANGEYGSVESFFQRVGKVTNAWKTKVANDVTDTFSAYKTSLSKDSKDWGELAAIEHKLTNTRERYVFDEDGMHLKLKGVADYEEQLKLGNTKAKPYNKLVADAPDQIPIESDLVRKFLKQHISTNAIREGNRERILQVMHGKVSARDPRVLYFPQRDPKDYPFKAFVVDSSVTGSGHMSMLHATSAEKLQEMINKVPTHSGFEVVQEPGLMVRTKPEIERWHKVIGDFKRSEALGDNYMDANMARTGVGGSYLPYTDPAKLMDDLVNWHKDKEAQLVRESIGLKYAKAFTELRHMDERHTDIANSRLGYASLSKYAAESVEGPYSGYVRTALDIPNLAAIPGRAMQGWLDSKVSQAWNEIAGATAKTSSVDQMSKINSMMDKFGIKPFDYDVATQALANHTVDRGVLSTFARSGNSLIAAISLSLDSLTGVTNTIGSLVLTAPELSSVLAMLRKNPEAMGELGAIMKMKIPGKELEMMSPSKLIAQGIKDFWDPAIRQMAKDKGYSTRHLTEVMDAYEHFALPEIYTTSDLNGKLKSGYAATMKLLDQGAGIFQTKLMEEFQRVTAMAMMKRITDVAVKSGQMSEAVADTYISTFVNRVQGNYLASQRPGMFHGPVGQMVGLFQTYNINFMQQLFRHVGDGSSKSAAMMMGLQGSIFGMSGLPGFSAINTHLVGSAAGNTDHKDIYKLMYNAVPKEIADWTMYGGLSNAFGLFHPDLKMNMYTRGDINPRHLTIVPTSFEDLPLVNISSRFFGNMFETAGKIIQGGGVANSLIQGLEHNSINRPLAGLAIGLEGLTNPEHKAFSTDNAGNMLMMHDWNSLATVARIFGAKPLDEARASEETFRNVVYQAKDKERIAAIAERLKTKVIGDEQLDQEDTLKFAHEYMKYGGKQEGFNQFLKRVMMQANTPKANLLAKHLSSYDAQTMQRMLGGRFEEFDDGDGADSEGSTDAD